MKCVLLAGLLLAACSTSDERTPLSNSAGKDDSIAIRMKLTDSAPSVAFSVGCDQQFGCAGTVSVKLKTPEGCSLFPTDTRCGVSGTDPLSREVLSATIVSTTEGNRTLPLKVESPDGMTFTSQLAAAFSATSGEDVEVTLEKTAGTPDLTIEVSAEWVASVDPGAEIEAVKTFLSSVPGLTYTETGTWMQGYHAFSLQYEQPIDHTNPALGTFKQSMVLQHRSKDAPTVLYTTGYALWNDGYLSELGTSLQANQLSTEQRYFGTSVPANLTPAMWQYVTIEQAAKDHHRIVEALKPLYSGAWLNTGHSKGGMTSIFHRRFFPQDLNATVAYVAPISYANPDPRYLPFLDTIGEEACRTAIRNVQKSALQQIDQLLPLAAADAVGQTFERTGGPASSLEKIIIMMEWLYWQHRTADECQPFLAAPTDAAGVYNLVRSYAGYGFPDSSFVDSGTYYYQAAAQLGMQSFQTSHLAGLLKHTDKPINWVPAGTMPVYDPAPMKDIAAWIKSPAATQILFVYGQYDPWSGGAYEIGTQPEVKKLVAPRANHGAMIETLSETDKKLALDKIELWIGKRPNLGTPAITPSAPAPRLF
jgi:hypothetical protein